LDRQLRAVNPLRRSLHRLQLQVASTLGAGIVSTPVIDSGAGILYLRHQNGDGSPSKPFALKSARRRFSQPGSRRPALGSPVYNPPADGSNILAPISDEPPRPSAQQRRPLCRTGIDRMQGSEGFFPRINNHGWFWATARSAHSDAHGFRHVARPRTCGNLAGRRRLGRRQQRKHLL